VGRPSETGVDVVDPSECKVHSTRIASIQMVANGTPNLESTKELSELVGRKTRRNAYFLAVHGSSSATRPSRVQFQDGIAGVGS
jgi:hypothetical protein